MSSDALFFKTIANAVLTGSEDGVSELVGEQFAHRIAAHQGNYQMSVQSALASGYPVVERLVGEEYMQGLVQEFIVKHPPKMASLTLYGDEFPAFLRKFAPVQKDLPWLSAIAELDRVWFEVYGARDGPALCAASLQEKAPGQLPTLAPGLHPSGRLLRFQIPAYSIWRTNKQDETVLEIDLKSGAEWAVFWRNNNQIHHALLDQATYVFLINVEAGQSFAVSFTEARSFDPEFDLQQQFTRWLSAGLFNGSDG